jgi:hypothetical protein
MLSDDGHDLAQFFSKCVRDLRDLIKMSLPMLSASSAVVSQICSLRYLSVIAHSEVGDGFNTRTCFVSDSTLSWSLACPVHFSNYSFF